MKFAIVGNNKHQRPTKGVKGFCPVCGEEVLAKCGNIKAHYWSHLANSKCVYKGNKILSMVQNKVFGNLLHIFIGSIAF